MTWDQILVTISGFFLIALIIKFFWMKPKNSQPNIAVTDGIQKQLVIVKGGYKPDTISVKKGIPVRLTFRREENASCSEMVVLPDFEKSEKLPEGKEINIDFTPSQTGEFEFTCQMGMYRGKLLVST